REYTENLEELVREKTEKLLEAEKLAAVGETVAGLSHAIKNIASGLKGGSFVLEQGLALDNRQYLDEGWGMVRPNVEKITQLSMDLLNYAKYSEIRSERGDPNQPAREVFDLMRQKAKDQGVDLQLDLDPGLRSFRFDPGGVHQCLLNLVANALDALEETGEGGDVRGRIVLRSARGRDAGVEYRVEDNGRGMDPDTRKNLFKAFFTTKGDKGAGIGLMMTKKIVELHGGALEVKSEKGVGSEFVIRIPPGNSP
ncbi:MAG: HAMP domain-containing histidine kinase, partial [Desulfobacterales bacterium]|nr:HAMP domain-containing histidine kinase [Desulfobacterales bacterium]